MEETACYVCLKVFAERGVEPNDIALPIPAGSSFKERRGISGYLLSIFFLFFSHVSKVGALLMGNSTDMTMYTEINTSIVKLIL